MDRPARHPEAGHPFQDLRDHYAKAWEYIEHLEARLEERIPQTRCRRIREQEERIAELESAVHDALQMIEAALPDYVQEPMKVRSVALNPDGTFSMMVSLEDSD